MSAEGEHYVRHYSPYSNSTFWFHLVLGGMADPLLDYELGLSDAMLAEQWPFSRRTIERARAELAEAGFITVLDATAMRYRFDFPEVPPNGRCMCMAGKRNHRQIGEGTPLASAQVAMPLLEAKASRGSGGGARQKARRPEVEFPVGQFVISPSMRSWLEQNGFSYLNIRRETEKFRDHALQNQRRCRDWVAAWRNWIRNAAERTPQSTNGSGVPVGGYKPLRIDPQEMTTNGNGATHELPLRQSPA